MDALITLIVVFGIFFFLFKKLKTVQNGSGNTGSGTKGRPGTAVRRQGYTNYRPHKNITSVSRSMGDKRSSVLRDDRANDWLAKQLEEEHRAFRITSEMFDLKIEHSSHCDARLVEQFHRRNCDAHGIDLANGSTIHKK